jgi:hypothetical protein
MYVNEKASELLTIFRPNLALMCLWVALHSTNWATLAGNNTWPLISIDHLWTGHTKLILQWTMFLYRNKLVFSSQSQSSTSAGESANAEATSAKPPEQKPKKKARSEVNKDITN